MIIRTIASGNFDQSQTLGVGSGMFVLDAVKLGDLAILSSLNIAISLGNHKDWDTSQELMLELFNNMLMIFRFCRKVGMVFILDILEFIKISEPDLESHQ
jgi:hypothetical protein